MYSLALFFLDVDFFRLFCETETTKTREWNQRFRSCCRLEGLLQLPQLLFSFAHSLLLRQCTRTVIYPAGQTRVFPLHLLNSAAGVNVTISLRLWQDVVSQLLKQSHHKCGWALLCWLISEIVKHVVWVGLSEAVGLFYCHCCIHLAEERCISVPDCPSTWASFKPRAWEQQLVFVNLCLLNRANESAWCSPKLFGFGSSWFIWRHFRKKLATTNVYKFLLSHNLSICGFIK